MDNGVFAPHDHVVKRAWVRTPYLNQPITVEQPQEETQDHKVLRAERVLRVKSAAIPEYRHRGTKNEFEEMVACEKKREVPSLKFKVVMNESVQRPQSAIT